MAQGNRAVAYLDAEDRSKQAFESFRRNFVAAQENILSLKGTLAGLAGAAGVGAFVYSLKSAIDRADEFVKMSQRAGGASVEWLSTTSYAAKLAGADMGEVENALAKLSVKLDEARGGNEKSIAQLERLGVNVKGVRAGTVSAEQAFDQIANTVRRAGDGFDKTGALVDVMGRNARRVIPLLNQDLGQLRGEAEKLGLKMSTDFARQAEEFNDRLTTLQGASEGARNALLAGLLPTLTDIANAMAEGAKQGGFFEGVLRGVQTALTGTDRAKNERIINELTEKRLGLLRQLSDFDNPEKAYYGQRPDRIRKQLDEVEAELRTHYTYRRQLDEEEAARQEAEERRRAALGRIGARPEGIDEKVFDNFKRQLEERLAKEGELGVFTETQKLLETERYKNLSAGEKQVLLQLAARIQQEQSLADLKKQTRQDDEALKKATDEADKREIERLLELRQKYIELADPVEKYRQQLAEVRLLLSKGLISQNVALDAEFAIQNAIEDLGKTGEKVQEVDSFAKRMGLTFNSAAEEAATHWKGVRALFNGLEQDIIRVALRMAVIEPAGKALSGWLDSKLGGVSFQGMATSIGAASSGLWTRLLGGGGAASGTSALADGTLSGFAEGGSFMVHGMGGTDSQMVRFRATPGERVTVETPAQQGRGGTGGAPVSIVMHINTPDVAGFRASRGQIAADMARGLELARRYS